MRYLFLSLAALAGLVLPSCETGGSFNSGYFDPLDAAGGGSRGPAVVQQGFKPGSFARAAMDNTAFFEKRPDGSADADKLLSKGTSMKVIANDGSYLKVELDSGAVGYVPAVMVEDPNAPAAPAGAYPPGAGYPPGSENEVQVWPPVPGGYPVEEAADPDSPVIPPSIDPDAPVEESEVPDIDPVVPDLDETPEPEVPPVPEVE